GMTRGAIYGNFASKEELLLAFVESQWKPPTPRLRKGAPLRENLRAIAESTIRSADERRAMAVGALSFQIYVLTHEEMRKQMAAGSAQIYRGIETALRDYIEEADLPMPLPRFIRVLHALSDGLMFSRFMEPEQFTDDVIYAAFDALAPRR